MNLKIKNYLRTLTRFLLLNFGGLFVGSLATTPGVTSNWYTGLDQAPWTPAGWVFGLAWTIIGITFSVFMTNEYIDRQENEIPWSLYRESLGLNVMWNFVFFAQMTVLAGVTISILSLIIFLMAHYTRITSGWSRAIWIMPYFIWLMIATSLNWYIVIMN